MRKRFLLTALAALGTLAFTASAHAAYLSLGTSNTSNATTTLTGNPAGAELLVKNTNGASASAFGLYGLLPATSPTASAAGVRGTSSSTNANGYGVMGTQAGSGTGVFGFTPSGRGVWGNTTGGIGVRGSSSGGVGVLGQHLATFGTAPGVTGATLSTADDARGVYGLVASSAPGFDSAAVYGQNNDTAANGIGVWGEQAGTGVGVLGDTPSGPGVIGSSSDGDGVDGYSTNGWGLYGASGYTGVEGDSSGPTGVYGFSDSDTGVVGSGANYGLWGFSSNVGASGQSDTGTGIVGASDTGTGIVGASTSGAAGSFQGDVDVTGSLSVGGDLNVAGTKNFRIDDPRAPAKRFLVHAAIESNQVLNVYSGNVTTNGKGLATVRLPGYFQLINTDYRYQLTVVGARNWDARAGVFHPIRDNQFTIRTDKPKVKVSWQVTAKRNDRYMRAHPFQAVRQKTGRERGRYVTPGLYGKPKADAIGHRKLPKPAKLPKAHKTPRALQRAYKR